MTLEQVAQFADIASAIFSFLGLLGIGGIIYVVNNKQQNKNNITVNGDAAFRGSFNLTNSSNIEENDI